MNKKLLSFCTAFTMLFTFGSGAIVNAESTSDSSTISKIVYVDGHGFNVTTTFAGDTVVESLENSTFLTMDNCGSAEMIVENIDGTIDEYDVEINSLTEENVDITLEQSGQIVQEVSSMDELIEDEYTGQVAVAGVVITADLVLSALALAAITVVVAGVTCYAVSEIADQIKKNANYNYYAYLRLGNVFIDPVSISDDAAVSHIRVTGDSGGIYTYYKDNAAWLAYTAGDGVTWRGPENHYAWYKIGSYYDHYHDTASGAHVWYGLPRNRSL